MALNTAKFSCKSTPSCLYGGSTAAEEVNMLNTVAISGVLGYPLELKKIKMVNLISVVLFQYLETIKEKTDII